MLKKSERKDRQKKETDTYKEEKNIDSFIIFSYNSGIKKQDETKPDETDESNENRKEKL